MSTQHWMVGSAPLGPIYAREKKKMKNLVASKKRTHWENFLTTHGDKNTWEIARIARIPLANAPK